MDAGKMLGRVSEHTVESSNSSRDSKIRARKRRERKKRERINWQEQVRRNEFDLI